MKIWKITRIVATVVVFALIFALMLFCNNHTEFMADDFHYMLSFVDDEPLRGVRHILPSMVAHTQRMNGRIVPHVFVQLFLLQPKALFNVVNALMFLALIYLICRIGRSQRWLVYPAVGVFAMLWFFTPAFGQVYLWLDGSCNYLWSVVFGLAFLVPFSDSFLHDRQLKGVWRWLFPLYAVAACACSENASAAVLAVSGILQLLEVFTQKKKLDWYKVLCMLAGFAGYLTIYFAPAQWENKSVALTDAVLAKNFAAATQMYGSFWVLLVIFAVLLAVNLACRADGKRIWLAGALLVGSLIANYIMVAAVTYPQRSAACVCILIVAAIAVLMGNLARYWRIAGVVLAVGMMLFTVYRLEAGVQDILLTYEQVQENLDIIRECAGKGIMELQIYYLTPKTQYSPAMDQQYISDDPDSWPNWQMAKAYGVKKIYATGRPAEE